MKENFGKQMVIISRKKMDSLGDIYKEKEAGSDIKIAPFTPFVIRLDGRAFHTFTRGLARPHDVRLTECMVGAAEMLVRRTPAELAYVQSDEISLFFAPAAEPFFAGRVQKLCSIAASIASVEFNKKVAINIPEKSDQSPVFDARILQMSSLSDVAGHFLWRQYDCIRNSVSMASNSCCGHKTVQGRNIEDQIKMLAEFGKPWEEMPPAFRYGTYVKRVLKLSPLTPEQLEVIPIKDRLELPLLNGEPAALRAHYVSTTGPEPMVKLEELAELYGTHAELRDAGGSLDLNGKEKFHIVIQKICDLENEVYGKIVTEVPPDPKVQDPASPLAQQGV